MQTKVNIHDAKTQLSKLLQRVMNGEKIIIAVIYRGGHTIIPQGTTVLEADDLVYAVTVPEATKGLLKLFGSGDAKTANKLIILGGGDVGFYLAEHLEENGYQAKVIERDEKRCEFLAEKLNKTSAIYFQLSVFYVIYFCCNCVS